MLYSIHLSHQVHGSDSQQLRAILSLYTCAMLGVIRNKSHINERIVSILIPHLTTSLKSRCRGYQASAYMVLSQLAANSLLKDSLLTLLVPVLTKVSIVPFVEGWYWTVYLFKMWKVKDIIGIQIVTEMVKHYVHFFYLQKIRPHLAKEALSCLMIIYQAGEGTSL